MKARFIDSDAVEVTLPSGDVLTLYRANVSRNWHAAHLRTADGRKVKPPTCFTPTGELLDLIEEAEKDRPESMDEFMARTEDTGVAPSLRRMAWATGQPIEAVVEGFEAAIALHEEDAK